MEKAQNTVRQGTSDSLWPEKPHDCTRYFTPPRNLWHLNFRIEALRAENNCRKVEHPQESMECLGSPGICFALVHTDSSFFIFTFVTPPSLTRIVQHCPTITGVLRAPQYTHGQISAGFGQPNACYL
jgi:hypothetical protein